jgi:hypothetical protein
VAGILRWIGLILLGVAGLVIIGGDIAYIVFADSKWSAIWHVMNEYNPYNIGSFLARVAFLLPGLAALWLSDRLRPMAPEG